MNRTKRTMSTTVVTLIVCMAGASATFAAADEGTPSSDRSGRITEICDDPDAALSTLTARHAHVEDRINRLEALRAKADASGHPRVVAKIDRRLTRLHHLLDRLTHRIDKAPEWIAEHCS